MKKVYILFLYTFLLCVPIGWSVLGRFGISSTVYFQLFIIMYIGNIVSAVVFTKETLSYTSILVFKIIHTFIEVFLVILLPILGLAGAGNPFLFLFAGFTAFLGYIIAMILNTIIIFSTSIHSIVNLVKDKDRKTCSKVIHIVLQLIFLLDFIDTIYLLVNSKKKCDR